MLNFTYQYYFQCLILTECNWFTPHSLLVISKIPKLKELRLNSCHRLGECVAYASLATRFGFKTLEVHFFIYVSIILLLLHLIFSKYFKVSFIFSDLRFAGYFTWR